MKRFSKDENSNKDASNGYSFFIFRKTVGTISNEDEKMMMDERGHMLCKFNNSVSHDETHLESMIQI